MVWLVGLIVGDDIAESVWLCEFVKKKYIIFFRFWYLSYLNVDFFPSHLMLKQLK